MVIGFPVTARRRAFNPAGALLRIAISKGSSGGEMSKDIHRVWPDGPDFPDHVDADDYDDDFCATCNNAGFIIECIDDLCANNGHCIHGDGEIACPDCTNWM